MLWVHLVVIGSHVSHIFLLIWFDSEIQSCDMSDFFVELELFKGCEQIKVLLTKESKISYGVMV